MKSKLLVVTLTLFFTIAGSAQLRQKEKSRPEMILRQLCATVLDKIVDKDDNSPHDYAYESIIYTAAEVDIKKDTIEEIRRKVQALWLKYQHLLICDSTQFNVTNGNIIKLGVHKNYAEFMDDIIDNWKVNLNYLDQSGETVLDYVQKEIDKSSGMPHEWKLKEYYKRLKLAGAKHKAEL